jgi:hypothetical protein
MELAYSLPSTGLDRQCKLVILQVADGTKLVHARD